jgi:hypothetical protein
MPICNLQFATFGFRVNLRANMGKGLPAFTLKPNLKTRAEGEI